MIWPVHLNLESNSPHVLRVALLASKEIYIYICQIKSHHLVIAWKLDAIFRTLYPQKSIRYPVSSGMDARKRCQLGWFNQCMKVLWPRESILFHPSIPTILSYGIGCRSPKLWKHGSRAWFPGHLCHLYYSKNGFRRLQEVKLLEVCFQGPKYLPTNQQMSRDTPPTFTYSTSNLLPIFN